MNNLDVDEHPILEFWPQDVDEIIQKVFANHIARMLWLGIKGNHIVNQYFNQACLTVAQSITNYLSAGKPVTGHMLTGWLTVNQMIGANEHYGDKLLPYVLGEKEILWTYKELNLEDGRGTSEFQAGLV